MCPYPNICIAALLSMSEFPSGFKFYIFCLISHWEQTVNTFKNYKILRVREVACCLTTDSYTSLCVMKMLIRDIYRKGSTCLLVCFEYIFESPVENPNTLRSFLILSCVIIILHIYYYMLFSLLIYPIYACHCPLFLKYQSSPPSSGGNR